MFYHFIHLLISHLLINKVEAQFYLNDYLRYLKLPDLNIPTLVDSLIEVVVLASMVPLQVHLADYKLAGIGQESPLDQHLNSQVVGLKSQPGVQNSLPASQGRKLASQGSQYVLEDLQYEQVK